MKYLKETIQAEDTRDHILKDLEQIKKEYTKEKEKMIDGSFLI